MIRKAPSSVIWLLGAWRQGRAFALPWVCAALATGCSTRSMPDPRDAAQEYAEAAARGDADAVYELMTEDAQRTHGRKGTKRLVSENRVELGRRAKALQAEGAKVRAIAVVRYPDGEMASLEVQDGRFFVSSAGALPAGARTPAQALDELRQVLARRSYSGLMRVLTADTRSALDSDLRSLVDGLEEPDTLDVEVKGDTAVVTVPGGHLVRLKREEGVWRVQDFD